MRTVNLNLRPANPSPKTPRAKSSSNQKNKQRPQLKNIIEVTEENEPNLMQQNPRQVMPQATEKKRSCLDRSLTCIKNVIKLIFVKNGRWELDVEDVDFIEIVSKISKNNYQLALPPQRQKRKTLILDLDETLVHSTFQKPVKYDLESELSISGRCIKIYTIKRFGLDSFLFEMSKLYQLVVFTASQKSYADKIIDAIDPKKRISYRLYRQNCIIINKIYYLKNLKILGRDLSQCIIVDDNQIASILQPDNLYKIDPFEGNAKDRALYRLMDFLKYISQNKNILPIKQQKLKFEAMQITLSESDQKPALISCTADRDSGRSTEQRKRQYKHKKTNSQIETLRDKLDQNEGQTSATNMINNRF